jgi:hypothetical protein
MRATGAQPTLDDYNFILEQFAAVGHHLGVMQVYKELTAVGIIPRTKTFGLCLQAIAHRLTLPIARKDRARTIAVTRRMVSDLVSAMKSLNIPFTSVNLDLTMRILKDTTDMRGFEMLMKWGYGIDLANPDCPPLEYMTDNGAVKAPTPQPFSTAALNTTIDTLGRLKNISRMVQAFEVLTTPLPKRCTNAASSSSSYHDEDEDDDYGASLESTPESTPVFTPPFAHPNTTTYNILIRHISRAGHAVFARHYLLQAMDLDRQVMLDLKRNLGQMPLQEVPAPHFAINRGTLLSVFGESNRDKNVGLMKWLNSKFHRILKKKRGELQFFTRHRAARQRKRLWPYEELSTYTAPALPSTILNRSTIRTPEPLSKRQPRFMTIMERWKAPKGVGAVFDVDLEDESSAPVTPYKSFDLDLHIRVLERDLAEIEALQAHVKTILERTTRRVKERLGRRVWHGKDIYLLTDGDRRRRVSMETWEQIAGFKPTSHGQRGKLKRHERYVFPWSRTTNQRPVGSGGDGQPTSVERHAPPHLTADPVTNTQSQPSEPERRSEIR